MKKTAILICYLISTTMICLVVDLVIIALLFSMHFENAIVGQIVFAVGGFIIVSANIKIMDLVFPTFNKLYRRFCDVE